MLSRIIFVTLLICYFSSAVSYRLGSIMATTARPNLQTSTERFESSKVTSSFLRRHSRLLATIDDDDVYIERETGIVINPRRFKKATKQLATLGPASNYIEMIEKLFLSGADIFRLNFSHGEHTEKANLVKMIRIIEKKYNHPIAILCDLQGPKLRVGAFENDAVQLIEKQMFTFDMKDELGDGYRVRLPHPEILNTLRKDDILLLDDGKLKMKVVETTMNGDKENPEGNVVCEVIVGGKLSNKKGVNTPSIVLPISPLTVKDRIDLEFIKTLDVDWVALSFVQTANDMREFRSLAGNSMKLMAKLEKPSAIDQLNEIVALSDGLMVARGDLGVEMNPWDVPIVQKQIVMKCKAEGKPVIIATQMMESMIENPTPTRAEASDCATAIYDSSDAVMLSAESAAGKYPVESVTMQQNIINRVEPDKNYQKGLDIFVDGLASEFNSAPSRHGTTNAITMAVRQVAHLSDSKAIVVFTSSGGTAMNVAKLRPHVPIIAACENIKIARQLALVWGVYPIIIQKPAVPFNIRVEIVKTCKLICDYGYADPATDLLTFTAGLPWGTPGTTNLIRVTAAAGPDHWLDPENEGMIKKFGSGIEGGDDDCSF